jgi:hypothetical protein
MKVVWDLIGETSRHWLKMDSGTMGMTALLKDLLVDTEWEGLIDVSVEDAHESFVRQSIRIMKPCHLGGLGALGVAVLEIQKLHSRSPRIGKVVG